MSSEARPWPLSFTLYRGMTGLLSGHLTRMAARRHAAMGADAARLGERQGLATLPRPDGPLVWINAASLGEVRAALAVVRAIGQTQVLLTTTTQTGAERAAALLPATARHQFSPLDTRAAMGRFLSHWRPDLAVMIESEVPMRAVESMWQDDTPMAWLNVRPSSTRSRFPKLFSAAMDRMALVTAQDRATEAELRGLGLRDAAYGGTFDLKALAPPPLADDEALAVLRESIGVRPVWLALSVHPEEGAVFAEAHRQILAQYPDACLIMAPRHPERAGEMAMAIGDHEMPRRSSGGRPDGPVYMADTTDEIGTLLALCPFAVIGGTFSNIGGHSPSEALALGRPVVHGPLTGAHEASFSAAGAAGAAQRVSNSDGLARAVLDWMEPAGRQATREAAAQISARGAEPLERLAERLAALLE